MSFNIYIPLDEGFGNKIFNLIIALYIKYINNVNIYSIIKKHHYHDKKNDHIITDIYPDLIKYLNILNSNRELYNKFKKDDTNIIYCYQLSNLNNFKLKLTKPLTILNNISYCYSNIYDMYNALPSHYKEIFKINKDLLDTNIINITNEKYIAVHIRYGDKIIYNLISKGIYKFKYLLYTPEYYIKMIKYLIKIHEMKVYILTDDIRVVNMFVMNKINNENVILLDLPFLESFYILTKANYILLNPSTFSLLATLFNVNFKKAYYLERPEDINITSPEEKLPYKNSKIEILRDKKYILNYNIDLMKNLCRNSQFLHP